MQVLKLFQAKKGSKKKSFYSKDYVSEGGIPLLHVRYKYREALVLCLRMHYWQTIEIGDYTVKMYKIS